MIWLFVFTSIFFLVLCCGAVVEFLVKRKQEKHWYDEQCKLNDLDREAIDRELGPWIYYDGSNYPEDYKAADKRRSNQGKGWTKPAKKKN